MENVYIFLLIIGWLMWSCNWMILFLDASQCSIILTQYSITVCHLCYTTRYPTRICTRKAPAEEVSALLWFSIFCCNQREMRRWIIALTFTFLKSASQDHSSRERHQNKEWAYCNLNPHWMRAGIWDIKKWCLDEAKDGGLLWGI